MNTILILTWRRPIYTARVLDAIFACRGIDRWRVQASWQVLGGDAAVPALLEAREIPFFINRCDPGINFHGPWAYDLAFSQGSDCILALEDDAVLSADSLELAEWFLAHPERDQHGFLAFGGAGGMDPAIVRRFQWHPSGFAWLFTREAWQSKIRPYWNCLLPYSWDYSVGYAMWKNRWTCMAPGFSRVLNIGRELGTCATPELFDKIYGRPPVHDGSPQEYQLVEMPDLTDYWNTVPEWAREYEGRRG